MKYLAHEIVKNGECCTLHSLAIRGSDLEDIGFEGKQIGAALDELLVMVIDEKIPNEREVLIETAREFGIGGQKRIFEL
jgi:tRNA nucleotidyltransferase (CCA-adding enzyme)